MKISQIVIIKEQLKAFDGKDLPSKLSYKLGRLEDKIDPIYSRFKMERDKLIIEKYGIKTDEVGNYQVPSDKMSEYKKEVLDLLDQEEEVEFKIHINLFDGVSTSKEFFKALGDIIEE